MSFDRPLSVGSYNARHDEIRASRAINFGPRRPRALDGRGGGCTHTAHNLPASSLFLTLYMSLTPPSERRAEFVGLISPADPYSTLSLDIVGFLLPVNMCRFTYTWLDVRWGRRDKAPSFLPTFAVINLLLFGGHRFPSLATREERTADAQTD